MARVAWRGRPTAASSSVAAVALILTTFGGPAADARGQAELHTFHCLHGCPVGAPAIDDIVVREIYTLASNDLTKMADWVAYRVTPQTIGKSGDRKWQPDPWLDPDEALEEADYEGAPTALGIDRGHQAPLAAFSGTPFAADTNILSNITPQGSGLNQAPWQRLEARELTLSQLENGAVYVLTGPLFERVMPAMPRADERHRVPSAYWKVIATADGQADSTEAARGEGKAFGAGMSGRAQAPTRTAPTADTVPGYGGTPLQGGLFDDPDAIAAQAASAAASSDGYRTVRSSLDNRPRIAVADIEATIARGQAIAADPTPFVSGMTTGGGQGACRELPPSAGSGATYEATCNVGVALEQREERCTVPLVVSVAQTSRYRYWCSGFNVGWNGVDDCGLFEQSQCTVTGSHEGRCLQGFRKPWEVCTEPGEPVDELLCDTQVAGARLRGTEVSSQVSERRDESACAAAEDDARCSLQEEACSSSDPVTRTISGVSVTKPCWAWERRYQCNRTTPSQDCSTLDDNAACRFVRAECLTDDQPCPTVERVYSCPIPDGPAAEKQYVCDGDVYCINGECETIEREPNREFKDAAVALNAASQAGRELDPDKLTLFEGERQTCHSKVFGTLNCCRGKAFPLLPGAQLLLPLGCDREEVLLHQRDAQGLCHYVGSYCSDSVLGVCVTKKKAYCCFESKLSRILQEQGRPQIGKPWAKPKAETCHGFTVDEFARLDLSRMDFSEVYAEFQDAAKLPEELATVEAMQRKIGDHYAIAGGGR